MKTIKINYNITMKKYSKLLIPIWYIQCALGFKCWIPRWAFKFELSFGGK